MAKKWESWVKAYRVNDKLRTYFMIFVILSWLITLQRTDAFLSPYVLCSLVGIIAFSGNIRRHVVISRREKTCGIVFSILFSVSVVLSNYKIYIPVMAHVVRVAVLLLGGLLIGWHIFIMALRLSGDGNEKCHAAKKDESKRWFWFSFLGIAAVYLIALFFCFSPGCLTPDSFKQIGQNLSGVYSNHHPFWHTMMIKICMDLGQTVFHDINCAVAVYSVFQILCMAAVFAYICMTMYQAGISWVWIVITGIVYAVVPYHLVFSMTMWKDVLFGGTAALFGCALYRMQEGIGQKGVNYIPLIIGALGCCLFRNNGMAAFILTFAVLFFVLGKTEKKMLWSLLAVIVVAFVLKHPVLKALGVNQPDLAEYLSIPEQQIARLIADDVPLEEDELTQIGKVMNIERARKEYAPEISDPIKYVVRETNQEYLSEHKWEYFTLWLRLGLKHPDSYLMAWIDQTKGYWNGGYEYWITSPIVFNNDFGIFMPERTNIVAKLFRGWVNKFNSVPIFEVFRSVGLHVWIFTLCEMILFAKKRKEGLICVMPIAVVLTLLISTPVFCEFRYAYAVFTLFPFVMLLTFFTPGKKKTE